MHKISKCLLIFLLPSVFSLNVLIEKYVNQTLAKKGDIIEITIRIKNFENYKCFLVEDKVSTFHFEPLINYSNEIVYKVVKFCHLLSPLFYQIIGLALSHE